ncbi:MAG: PH domain-containing protein [Tunicatimonas sp.]|uniref:PH domain-containing protein n=1 Tax=Tunicatimonas sp. TaxID=1940096 RepID=UPI003C725F01
MKFWSKRNYSMAALLWIMPLLGSIGLFILLIITDQLFGKNLIGLLVISGLTVILIYLWRNTYYRIKDGQLMYRSGVFSGSVPINQIESIQRSDYPTTGNRPAKGSKGLLIRYQGGRSIFVSPADEVGFMQELQENNSRLRILPKSPQGG